MSYQDPYHSPYSAPHHDSQPQSQHYDSAGYPLSDPLPPLSHGRNISTNDISSDYASSEKGILRQSTYSNVSASKSIGGGGRTARIPRFQGAELNASKERPSSQWTQGIEPPPKSTGILRMWRKENRASWVRGGGFRTTCRMFSCCFLSFIFVFLAILLTILLFVRPPNITLNGVTLPSSNAVEITTSGLVINFDLNISATNPNWFSADFTEISAIARYPGNNTNTFGGGALYNQKFGANSASTFDFPFVLNYTTAKDPNSVILKDLIAKCEADPVEDITVDYDLTLKLKIIAINISPTISSSATFACPLDSSEIESLSGLSLKRRDEWAKAYGPENIQRNLPPSSGGHHVRKRAVSMDKDEE